MPKKLPLEVFRDPVKQTAPVKKSVPPADMCSIALADHGKTPEDKLNEVAATTQTKNKRKNKESEQKRPAIGSSRGIETMFRTSYQAQLDMIALATTKSNIMISLNGVLISVLLLSAAYLINTMPMLVVPIGSLMLTCTVAIIFAVLAARPDSRSPERALEDVRDDRGGLLIFDEFSHLPVDQYIESMMDMLRDHQRVYKNMAAHIHDMGQTANEKFGKLYIAYSTFMVGLVVSVLLLLVVVVKRLVVLI